MSFAYGMSDTGAVTAGSAAIEAIRAQIGAMGEVTQQSNAALVPAGSEGASSVALFQQKDSLAAFMGSLDQGLRNLSDASTHVATASVETAATDLASSVPMAAVA